MKTFTKCKDDDTFENVKGIKTERVIFKDFHLKYNDVGRIEYGDYFI